MKELKKVIILLAMLAIGAGAGIWLIFGKGNVEFPDFQSSSNGKEDQSAKILEETEEESDIIETFRKYCSEQKLSAEIKAAVESMLPLETWGYVKNGFMDVKSSRIEEKMQELIPYGLKVMADPGGTYFEPGIEFEGCRVRECVMEKENWRYYDELGECDLLWQENEKKLRVASEEEFENRTAVLSVYEEFYQYLDSRNEEALTE